jgi:3-oxoacyl-[acyl-carrier-protein] synthase-3
MPELRRDTPNLSIEYMGCSAIAKAVDCARWFLTCQPDKYVLICFMDAITPLSPPLPGTYAHFSEVSSPQERQQTVNAMHGLLFGDAAVAMLLSAHAPGPSFGPIVHLTNATACDAELGTFYATSTVAQVLAQQDRVKDPKDTTRLLMHTGSERILDGLCQEFGVSPQSPAVASSYRVLRDYGNTIGCSVPLMLADPEPWPEGDALMVAFGLSFSCGAGVMTVPQGGWAV